MAGRTRVRNNDEYNMSDWYAASRESKGISLIPQQQQQQQQQHYNEMVKGHHQAPQQRYNEMPQHHYNEAPRQHNQLPQQYHPHSNSHWNAPPRTNSNRAYHDEYAHNDRAHPQDAQAHSRPQTAHSHDMIVLSNLPKGVRATQDTVQAPADVQYPALHRTQSQQPLMVETQNLRKQGYQPPTLSGSTTGRTQYPTTAEIARGKSVSDRYGKRRAGGDSGTGECCSSLCSCCNSCLCCLGPIITTILVVAVLVGIALALYFNWDRITKGGGDKSAGNLVNDAVNTLAEAVTNAVSPTPPAPPPVDPAAAPPAAPPAAPGP